jgi:hypothetical protein
VIVLGGSQVAAVSGASKMLVGLGQRAPGDDQESGELGGTKSAETFSDVPWPRGGSIPYLTTKPEILSEWHFAPATRAAEGTLHARSGAEPLEPLELVRSYRLHQLVPADRRRAELADDDGGGVIGEDGGFEQRGAGGEGHGQRRDDGVAGAGDVRHFSRR